MSSIKDLLEIELRVCIKLSNWINWKIMPNTDPCVRNLDYIWQTRPATLLSLSWLICDHGIINKKTRNVYKHGQMLGKMTADTLVLKYRIIETPPPPPPPHDNLWPFIPRQFQKIQLLMWGIHVGFKFKFKKYSFVWGFVGNVIMQRRFTSQYLNLSHNSELLLWYKSIPMIKPYFTHDRLEDTERPLEQHTINHARAELICRNIQTYLYFHFTTLTGHTHQIAPSVGDKHPFWFNTVNTAGIDGLVTQGVMMPTDMVWT